MDNNIDNSRPQEPLPQQAQAPSYSKDISSADYRAGEPTVWQQLKKLFVPIGIVLLIIIKFGAKLKFLIIPIVKFFPLLLKTGGTMVISIWFYAMNWGWKFAVGFVLLMLVHECGHLLAAKRVGLKVGAPVFIPFMGAFIALKDAPKNAWIEAQVAIGGPLLGGIGAIICFVLYIMTGQPLFSALAYFGFFLNLFNLAPIGVLDGGRVVSALSLWLWIIGFVIMGFLIYMNPNFILFLIIFMSLPYMWTQYKNRKSDFFKVTLAQRLLLTFLYFGLIALMVVGMTFSHVRPPEEPQAADEIALSDK
ncbi:MAG TPA: site-2 protease family protein [Lentisphaeria bacterium]|nr:MAG: hypothetical protein A2X48_20235 [Lentisphaerae bacterium GWF2_49_21]HBC86202.1 site-2 protease family protein [Lentisphaeria bacterium]